MSLSDLKKILDRSRGTTAETNMSKTYPPISEPQLLVCLPKHIIYTLFLILIKRSAPVNWSRTHTLPFSKLWAHLKYGYQSIMHIGGWISCAKSH